MTGATQTFPTRPYSSSSTPESILIMYAWGNRNPGDKALGLGTIECLHKLFPHTKLSIVSMFTSKDAEFDRTYEYISNLHPSVRILPNDFFSVSHVRSRTLRRLIKVILLPPRLVFLIVGTFFPQLLKLAFLGSSTFASFGTSDLVLINAGHLLFWNQEMGERYTIFRNVLLPLFIANRLGIKYGFHAQSFGPFEFSRYHFWARKAFRWILAHSSYTTVRESQSLRHVCRILSKSNNTPCVLDPAFFVSSSNDADAEAMLEKHALVSHGFICMTIRLSKRGSAQDLASHRYNSYAAKLRRFIIEWSNNQSMPIVLVSQVSRDIADVDFILSLLPDNIRNRCVLLREEVSPEFLRSFYRHAALVIGMRFHSLVFALSVNTPVIGLTYYDIGPKITGLMQDFGFPENAFLIDDASPSDLYIRAIDLVSRHNQISAAIKKRLKRLRDETFSIVKKNLQAEY